MGDTVTILIAEHEPVYRAGLRALLEDAPDFEIVAETGSGAGVVKSKRLWETRVLVLDVALPGTPNARDLVRILGKNGKTHMLAVAETHEADETQVLLTLGARGCILKRSTADDLIQAVRVVSTGHCFIDSELAAQGVKATPGEDQYHNCLNAEEREFCKLLASGYTTAEAAALLQMTEASAIRLRDGVMQRIGLDTTADLVHFAIDNGFAASR